MTESLQQMLSYFLGKRILVTGASGYMATNLIQALSGVDCTIVRLSRKARLPQLSETAEVVDITADIREHSTWTQAMEGVHIVYHFAAQTSLRKAESDPLADLESNVIPMLHLLNTCQKAENPARVLFAGTVTQAGITPKLPVDETHVDQPVTIYDLHKLAAENYLKHYSRQKIVLGVVLRLANVYGPGPHSASMDRGILNQMIKRALSGEALTIYGKGEYLRDYVYVQDVIYAFLTAASHMDRLNANHYVIGSGRGHTITQALNLVAERTELKTGNRPQVKHIEPPVNQSPIEERNFVADTQRFGQATGWKARFSLIEGIDNTLSSMISQANP